MTVAADNQIDCVVQLLHDGGNVRASQITGAPIDVAQRTGLRAALMHQHDDGFNALRAQFGNQRIDRGGLVTKLQTGHTGRRHNGGRGFERHADKGHLHAVELFGAVGGQQGLAVRCFNHVG